MKLKILLLPTLVMVLIFSLWFIYPSFSNGVDGLKEKYEQLNVEKVKLEEVINKKNNILALKAELDSRPEDAQVLYDFIPSSREDEEIVDSLNYFAFNSGLSVFGISVTKGQAVAPVYAEESDPAQSSEEAVLPQLQNITVEIQFAGSYEKMKEFITNMGKLNRYNNFSLVNISKEKTDENEKDFVPNSDFLMAKLTADFNVLDQAKFSQGHLENPIFSSSKLDFGIISQIREGRSQDVPALNVDQKGRLNPFTL